MRLATSRVGYSTLVLIKSYTCNWGSEVAKVED